MPTLSRSLVNPRVRGTSPRRPALFLLCCLALAGCKSKASEGDAKVPEAWIVYPVYREVEDHEDFTGQTESEKSVVVMARATGHLKKINFADGAMVKKDDVLFEIDHREYKAALDKADAEVRLAQARVLEAELIHNRAQDPSLTQSIPPERREQLLANRDAARANVLTAEASKQTAAYNLAWCQVTAEISGRISRRMVDAGNIVEREKTVLTNIVSLDPMYAKFFIDERTVLRLQKNVKDGKLLLSQDQKLGFRIGLADETGYSIDGKLDFVDNKVDTGTGTLLVRGTFDNTIFIPGTWPWERFSNFRLPPGLFIRIRLPVGDRQKRLLIPEKAIGTDQDKKFIYIVDADKKVQRRAIQLGTLQEDGMRVIGEEDLKWGEMVIVKGLQRVRPGMLVEPKVDTTATGK